MLVEQSISEPKTYRPVKILIRLWSLTGTYRWFVLPLLFAALVASLVEVGYLESIRRLVKGASESQFSLIYSGLLIGVSIVVLRIVVTVFTTWTETAFQQKHKYLFNPGCCTPLGRQTHKSWRSIIRGISPPECGLRQQRHRRALISTGLNLPKTSFNCFSLLLISAG